MSDEVYFGLSITASPGIVVIEASETSLRISRNNVARPGLSDEVYFGLSITASRVEEFRVVGLDVREAKLFSEKQKLFSPVTVGRSCRPRVRECKILSLLHEAIRWMLGKSYHEFRVIV